MKPNPGSNEAIDAGCTCPVLDNGHGKGSGFRTIEGEPAFWIAIGCPLHGAKKEEEK
jgi:hypothetical protein